MINKKAQATVQLTILIIATFAFAYIIHQSDQEFREFDLAYKDAQAQKSDVLVKIVTSLTRKITKPIFPLVSAEEIGCCQKTLANEYCVVSAKSQCSPERLFATNTQCEQTSFCKLGCCVDDSSGTCDKNTIKSQCQGVWTNDKNCNLEQCQLGCCDLGNSGILATEKQCEIYTQVMVLGENKETKWDPSISEAQCVLNSLFTTMGACISAGSDGKNECKFTTNKECVSLTGTMESFIEGKLCTSPELNTNCKQTQETTCVDGKDGVYFKDSCGNPANIYDANRMEEAVYWDNVFSLEESCGAGSGNANSQTCGNCNRFLGGACSSDGKLNTLSGENYCKSTSCIEDGVTYKNGESWCVYDGKIGDGDDVVGSRHWRHVCNEGEIQVEPCADYRNAICVQSNTLTVNGSEVEFRQSFCRPNMWRDCMEANDVEKGESKEVPLDCVLKKINGGGSYDLEFVVPKYPPGFDLSGKGALSTGADICVMATMTCTYVEAPKTWGGCEVVDGDYCKTPEVLAEMNDFCRSLGDCGAKANIVGNVQESCKYKESEGFPQGYFEMLASLANPVKGQYAEPGDLSEYMEAAGMNGQAKETDDGWVGTTNQYSTYVGMGAGAVGYLAAGYGVTSTSYFAGTTTITVANPAINAFGYAAIGASVGMMVGGYLAKMGGAPSGWSMVAMAAGAVAGAIVATGLAVSGALGSAAAAAAVATTGATAGGAFFATGGALLGLGPVGWIVLAIAVIVMLVAAFAFGADCEVTEVEFTCEPWQPPTGGEDCKKCNEDPLKPCSPYRCQSLGAACNLINVGTEEEMCEAMKNDATPPVISMGTSSGDTIFSQTSNGFKVTTSSGGCLNAYDTKLLNFTTNKPAQCRFDTIQTSAFENMSYSFGTSYYTYNHILPFQLPDPSHGMSQGLNWTGDLNLYILCQDVYGNRFRTPYQIEACVYQGKDITPPTITKTEPATNSLLAYNTTSKNLTIYTTEPSTCKWSTTDKPFSEMTSTMNCQQNLNLRGLYGYPCTTNLPINATSNNFFISCQDQPWLEGTENQSSRVSMTNAIKITLDKVASPIKIDSIAPSGDLETPTTLKTVTLGVQTSAGAKWHTCSYSFSNYENMISFLNTGEREHTQEFNLQTGTHKIYVECKDETGDVARGEANFRVMQDTNAPNIARIFSEGSNIKVITNEEAECRYSIEKCSFDFSKGISMGSGKDHTIPSEGGKVYYVKCKDEWENAPSSCTVTIAGV
jgi:hypothetical protein